MNMLRLNQHLYGHSRPQLCRAYVALIFLCTAGTWPSMLRAQDPPTVQMVVDAIRRSEALLFESESFRISYERVDTKTVTPSPNAGELLTEEWTTAYRHNKWFCKRRFTKPFRTKDFVVPGEPETFVTKNGLVLEWRKFNDSAVLAPVELGRNSYRDLDYFRNLSLNAPRYIARSLGIEDKLDEIRKQYQMYVDLPFLPEFLEQNKSHYQVSPTEEPVDGSPCWVFEWKGMDKLWIDAKQLSVVRRREYTWGPNKPLRFDVTNSDYRELKAGLWLPFKQKTTEYFNPQLEKPELAGKVEYIAHYIVHEIEFDRLTDAFFDIDLPVGTHVFDVPRDFNYVVSRDTNDPFQQPVVQGLKQLNSPSHLWLYINIVIVILLAVLVGYRAWSARSSN